ncbi:hypothetical protein sr12607 [Sporisorium reilianum SRZ2]|uniref:Uncharacterized protein n=1 Tax=Sporisorium reilianum (strain SRZ2) TaxID=999809 RepID=E6ZWZ4_SPORE|nr:hypothetical protein sr12607 [Sporisorium reilianum SRZ2]
MDRPIRFVEWREEAEHSHAIIQYLDNGELAAIRVAHEDLPARFRLPAPVTLQPVERSPPREAQPSADEGHIDLDGARKRTRTSHRRINRPSSPILVQDDDVFGSSSIPSSTPGPSTATDAGTSARVAGKRKSPTNPLYTWKKEVLEDHWAMCSECANAAAACKKPHCTDAHHYCNPPDASTNHRKCTHCQAKRCPCSNTVLWLNTRDLERYKGLRTTQGLSREMASVIVYGKYPFLIGGPNDGYDHYSPEALAVLEVNQSMVVNDRFRSSEDGSSVLRATDAVSGREQNRNKTLVKMRINGRVYQIPKPSRSPWTQEQQVRIRNELEDNNNWLCSMAASLGNDTERLAPLLQQYADRIFATMGRAGSVSLLISLRIIADIDTDKFFFFR